MSDSTDQKTGTRLAGKIPGRCREDFPSLLRCVNGKPLVYFDGPAGTQVPGAVIDAISDYYRNSNANTHGAFVTSIETGNILDRAREMMAAFLGADSASNISFGANMTSLAFSLSRAFSKLFVPGDEVLITQLDHEANRGPWKELGRNGITVREVQIKPNGTLDYEDMARKISSSTRLVAVGMASNALGTVNDIHLVRNLTRKANAWLLVDAVHYAPHFPVDVKDLDIDFLLCSAYKFYGPHVGILYSREGLLDMLDTDCLCTQVREAPYKIETGTLNHASIAGVVAALEFLSGFGHGQDTRVQLASAMEAISEHEYSLAAQLAAELKAMPGIRMYGPPFDKGRRTPTLSLTLEGKTSPEVSAFLAEQQIFTWSGHFYAIRPVEVLGLLDTGGLVRIGISMYNTPEDIGRLIAAFRMMFGRN